MTHKLCNAICGAELDVHTQLLPSKGNILQAQLQLRPRFQEVKVRPSLREMVEGSDSDCNPAISLHYIINTRTQKDMSPYIQALIFVEQLPAVCRHCRQTWEAVTKAEAVLDAVWSGLVSTKPSFVYLFGLRLLQGCCGRLSGGLEACEPFMYL